MDDAGVPPLPPAPRRKTGFLGLFKKQQPKQGSADKFIDALAKKSELFEEPIIWPDESIQPAEVSEHAEISGKDDFPVMEDSDTRADMPLPDLPELPDVPDWRPEHSAEDEVAEAVGSAPPPVPEVPHDIVVKAERIAKEHVERLKKELAPSVKKVKKTSSAKSAPKRIPASKEVHAINEDVENVVDELHGQNRALEEDLTRVVQDADHGTVHPGKYFVLKGGRQLKSFRDLVTAIDRMDESTFQYHVKDDRHDFAQWVKDVLRQEQLAERMRTAKAKRDLLILLRKHVHAVDAQLDRKRNLLLKRKRENLGTIERLKNRQASLAQRANELDHREAVILEKERAAEAKIHSRLLLFERATAARERALGVREKTLLDRVNTQLVHAKVELAKVKAETESLRKMTEDEIARKQALWHKRQAAIKDQVAEAQALEQERIKLKGLQDKYEFKLKRMDEEKAKIEVSAAAAKKMIARADSLHAIERKLDAREASLSEREKRLEHRSSTIQKERSSLHREEEAIQTERTDADRGVFDKYLESKLKEITPDVHLASPPPGVHHRIYDDIDECRGLLAGRKFEEAKRSYNRIKSDFQHAKLSPNEKNQLYNAVRELYDDIHLALLSG